MKLQRTWNDFSVAWELKSKEEAMANRCSKIPQVIVRSGPWHSATTFIFCVSVALGLEGGVERRWEHLCFRWCPGVVITGEAESQEGPCSCQKLSQETDNCTENVHAISFLISGSYGNKARLDPSRSASSVSVCGGEKRKGLERAWCCDNWFPYGGGSAQSSSQLPQETILSGPRAQWFLSQLSK